MYDLTDALAVVTGGSRGIGWHVASALHAAGLRVVVTGRDPATLAEAARRVGARCHAVSCDHRDPEAIRSMAHRVLEDHGPPRILVNNAGVMRSAAVVEMSLDEWNEVIQTNLTGVFLTTQAFLPAMLQHDRADIFMISSMSGKKGDPGAAAYAASKFGLQGFSQSLMYEVRKRDIRVIVLNPSSVDTTETPGPDHGPGLLLHARDVADTIVHLARLPGRTMVRDLDIYGTNP